MRRAALVAGLALVWTASCASTPPAPPTGRSTAWGYVKLVPREGVTPGGGGGSYSDRRMRDVRFVDYSHPGFAVVYVQGAPRGGAHARIEIHNGEGGVALSPPHAALARGGVLEVANATSAPHVLSSPGVGVVRALAPGEVAEMALGEAGEQELFLLDRKDAVATIFIAPGPFVVVSDSGRFELADIEPGRRELHVWHPRFPPAAQWVDLPPDRVTRVDLELGVDRMQPEDERP